MKFSTFVSFPALLAALLMSGLSAAQENISKVTIDGLHLIEDTNLARVYVQPGVDLSQYNRVNLGDAYIAFKSNWQQGQNNSDAARVSANDIAKMKIELSSLFREVFSRTLEEGGYDLVTERAEDVLLIKPAIINLDVTNPDNADSNTRSYSESAGEMTLYLELYDSVSDDLIAKAIDRQQDRQTGHFQWQDRISNRAAANRILQEWARVLKEGLDEARGAHQ